MRRRISIVLMLLWSCDHSRHDQPPSPSANQSQFSMETISGFLERGECERGVKYLKAIHESARTVEWYDYMSQTHLVCGEASLDGEEERLAIAVLDEGLKRYPRSSRLLKAKASRYDSFGDSAKATHFNDAARDAANRNRREGHGSFEDEAVLSELEYEARQRGKPRMPDKPIPTIAVDVSSHWASRVPELVASRRCIEALRLLKSLATRTPLWYELAAQANAVCFIENAAPAYRAEALATLQRGIVQFPSSIRLRLTRAVVHELLGDRNAAEKYYGETAELARRNIAGQTAEAEESRRVLHEIEAAGKLGGKGH